MKQLTMNDIYDMCKRLKKEGFKLEELPVVIGDDEELNGVHTAYFCEMIEEQEIIDMLENSNELGILIS